MINKNKKIMKMILEKNKKVSMGNRSGLGFLDDPVRLTFTLSRYKFVAKMFEGFNKWDCAEMDLNQYWAVL